MKRREFIKGVGAVLAAASAALTLGSCGGGGGGGASPSPSVNGFDVVSSPDNTGHIHSVRIFNEDLSSPPPGGVVYTSTSSFSHIHTITLSQQQLIDISNGSTVTVVSSADGAPLHTHTWTIRKP